MGKRTLVLLVVLAAAGVLVAVLPFDRPGGRWAYTVNETSEITPGRCSAPILSAWHDERPDGGWFGYEPLTAIPPSAYPPGLHTLVIPGWPQPCAEPARQRLAIGALLVLPGLLMWFLRRRRIDPPPNTLPNLAA